MRTLNLGGLGLMQRQYRFGGIWPADIYVSDCAIDSMLITFHDIILEFSESFD
jgi:hypothetical protein